MLVQTDQGHSAHINLYIDSAQDDNNVYELSLGSGLILVDCKDVVKLINSDDSTLFCP